MKNKLYKLFFICLAWYTAFLGNIRVFADETDQLIQCGDFQGLISDAFRFFKILAPVLLILFGTLDFVGAVVSADGDIKKSGERFAKRLAAAALVFLIPTLINIILGFAVERKFLPEYLKCWL